jgi:hypothetical protein
MTFLAGIALGVLLTIGTSLIFASDLDNNNDKS